jgi:hypothetical protein
MATRKHRARRAKTFRHDMPIVEYDEEGNEVEVTASELRARKGKPATTAKAKPATGSKGRSRALREPQPPSWHRSIRRGGIWGGATVAASVLLLRGTPLPARILIGAIYAGMFIPLTHWVDGLVYRRYQRQQGTGPAPRSGKTR